MRSSASSSPSCPPLTSPTRTTKMWWEGNEAGESACIPTVAFEKLACTLPLIHEWMGGFGWMLSWSLKWHQCVVFNVVRAADDDSDQSERPVQRGPAHGGGGALAGLSPAGVLQPGQSAKEYRTQREGNTWNFSFSVLRAMWRSWRVFPSRPSWTGIRWPNLRLKRASSDSSFCPSSSSWLISSPAWR